MSALRIRRRLRRHHRRLAILAAVLALAGAILVHHGGMLMDTHQDMGMGSAIEMCLGVFTAVGAAVAAAGLAVLALGRRRPAVLTSPGELVLLRSVPIARARHGPELLSLLCVSRR